MALTQPTEGVLAVGTTSLSPALSGTTANNDLLLTTVVTKPDTATINTPTDWTLVGDVAGGGGSFALDTGPTRAAIFQRIKDAGWSTAPTVSITSGDSTAGRIWNIRCAAGKTYDVACVTGVYGAGGTTTNGTVVMGSDPGIQGGDLLFGVYSSQSDSPTWSAQSVTVPGCVLAAGVEKTDVMESTNGFDVGGMVFIQNVTSGTSSGAPTVAATASVATRGVVVLVRIREVDPPALTVQDATHAHTAGNAILTQTHELTVAGATQAHTAQNVALTQVHSLVVQDAAHAQSAETPSVQVVLGVQAATHAVTSDSPTLTQVHNLTVQDATHAHTAANVALVVDLAVQAATHGHTAEAPSLTQVHNLTVAAAVHGQTVENVTLGAAGTLSVDDTTHAHSAENVALTQMHALTVADAGHAQTVEAVTLTQQHILVSGSSDHGQTVEIVVLTQVHLLVVQDAAHAHTASNVTVDVDATPLRDITVTGISEVTRPVTFSSSQRTVGLGDQQRQVTFNPLSFLAEFTDPERTVTFMEVMQ